jgi:hypothetical protein
MMLVHHREELRQYRDDCADSKTKMHIALLLSHLDDEAGSKGSDVKEMIKSGLITFPLLWMIFKPGDLICEHSNDHTRLFQVRKHGYGESSSRGKWFDINCSFVSYDGVKVGLATERLRIWDRVEFFGLFSTKVTSLSCYPLKFLEDSTRLSIEASMSERGKRYLEIKEVSVMQYDGLFLYLKRPPWDYYDERMDFDGVYLPETMSGRVVVDPKTFNEEARKRKETIAADADKESKKNKDKEEAKPCKILHFRSL